MNYSILWNWVEENVYPNPSESVKTFVWVSVLVIVFIGSCFGK